MFNSLYSPDSAWRGAATLAAHSSRVPTKEGEASCLKLEHAHTWFEKPARWPLLASPNNAQYGWRCTEALHTSTQTHYNGSELKLPFISSSIFFFASYSSLLLCAMYFGVGAHKVNPHPVAAWENCLGKSLNLPTGRALQNLITTAG